MRTHLIILLGLVRIALDENGEPLPVNDTRDMEILWRYHHEEGAGGLVENDAFGEEAYTFYRNEPYDDLRANCTDGCALIYARPFIKKIFLLKEGFQSPVWVKRS